MRCSGLPTFYKEKTHQVLIENQLSGNSEVTSGVMEGSVLGPDLYTVLANSLLERMKLPSLTFADDFKFVGDITIYSHTEIQAEVATVADWSEKMSMPLSVEKSVVMHYRAKQPNYDYTLYGESMKVVTSFTGHVSFARPVEAIMAIVRPRLLRQPKWLEQ